MQIGGLSKDFNWSTLLFIKALYEPGSTMKSILPWLVLSIIILSPANETYFNDEFQKIEDTIIKDWGVNMGLSTGQT